MAEITKTLGHDGKPRYQTRVYVGGKQHMITARNKSELAQMERQMRDEYARGTLAEGARLEIRQPDGDEFTVTTMEIEEAA